jgi:polyhydroxyalkanoate synthesis repressor PhaR
MKEPIRIKKYGNRRFYSSTDKRYVTLAELAQWVMRGKKIQVLSEEGSQGETDITAEVLTQILLEQGSAQFLPIELLEAMIRSNEKQIQTFWTNLMQQNLSFLEQWRDLTLGNMKMMMRPFKKKSKDSKL